MCCCWRRSWGWRTFSESISTARGFARTTAAAARERRRNCSRSSRSCCRRSRKTPATQRHRSEPGCLRRARPLDHLALLAARSGEPRAARRSDAASAAVSVGPTADAHDDVRRRATHTARQERVCVRRGTRLLLVSARTTFELREHHEREERQRPADSRSLSGRPHCPTNPLRQLKSNLPPRPCPPLRTNCAGGLGENQTQPHSRELIQQTGEQGSPPRRRALHPNRFERLSRVFWRLRNQRIKTVP